MARLALHAAIIGGVIASTLAHTTARSLSHLPLGCGFEATDRLLETVAIFSTFEEAARNATATSIAERATVTIDTYFHVVAQSTALSGGYIPTSQLTEQLAVMNEHYATTGFQFNLVSTDYTVNASWASAEDGNDLEMKTALRKGTYKDLNLYFQYSIAGFLGVCNFPTTAPAGSDAFFEDGCNILYSTTPGGTSAPYDLGGTVSHEVGHWMSLFHVFQGGCVEPGDGIADTPPQLLATIGCPTGQDSCSGDGFDSIHNYMDYSDDACYTEFTPNQITRMTNMWDQYRAAY